MKLVAWMTESAMCCQGMYFTTVGLLFTSSSIWIVAPRVKSCITCRDVHSSPGSDSFRKKIYYLLSTDSSMPFWALQIQRQNRAYHSVWCGQKSVQCGRCSDRLSTDRGRGDQLWVVVELQFKGWFGIVHAEKGSGSFKCKKQTGECPCHIGEMQQVFCNYGLGIHFEDE